MSDMTEQEVSTIRNSLYQEDARLDALKEKQKIKWKELQSKCPHKWHKVWHQDPAGGFDSWSQCCACHGEV